MHTIGEDLLGAGSRGAEDERAQGHAHQVRGLLQQGTERGFDAEI